MSSDEIKEMLEQVKAQLAEAQEFFAKVNEPLAELTNEENTLRDAYNKQMQDIRNKKYALQQQVQTASQKANQLAYQVDSLNAKYESELAAEEAAKAKAKRQADLEEKNRALTELWDTLTINAKWREWAKDHQLIAAKKIVANRYVIEADPMGLGKTMVAIATCDMAERATKEASPEFPFLGEEKDVYVPGYWVAEDGTNLGSYPSMQAKQQYNATFVKSHYEPQIVNSITRPVGRRVLYLCPSSLIRNVMEEFRVWAPHRNVTYVGTMTRAEKRFVFEFVLANQEEFVLICNYESWRRDTKLLDEFIEADFDTVILDEAHNLKDMKSIAYTGVKKVLDSIKPEYVIPMTGTPIMNRPQELFTLLTLVNPEQFYNLQDYLYTYCEQNDEGKWYFQDGGLERIGKRIGKNYIRRTRDQAGIELPPVTVINHEVDIDEDAYPEQARVRKEMREYATIMIDENKGKAIPATAKIAVLTRLRQVETWPAGIKVVRREKQGGKSVIVETLEVNVKESQKIDYIIRHNPEDKQWDGLIPEVIEEEKVVLFSQFVPPLYEIANRVTAAGFRPIVLVGETPDDIRNQIRRNFDVKHTPNKKDMDYDIVLCHYKTGGVGLNFTNASQCIILDEAWNPAVRDQGYGRLDRIGQEHPVTVHVVRASSDVMINGKINKAGIDVWLAGIMEFKENIVDGFNNVMITDTEFKDALDSGLI